MMVDQELQVVLMAVAVAVAPTVLQVLVQMERQQTAGMAATELQVQFLDHRLLMPVVVVVEPLRALLRVVVGVAAEGTLVDPVLTDQTEIRIEEVVAEADLEQVFQLVEPAGLELSLLVSQVQEQQHLLVA
jgi:hypothetical protein